MRDVKAPKISLALTVVLVTFSSPPIVAQTRDAQTPKQPPLQQGSTIANKANVNERSPGTGVTKDLTPDDKQSATGGPVGGGGLTGGSSGY